MDNELKNTMKDRIIGLIRKPQQQVKEKKPMNMSWLAFVGFNAMMAFLDVISGVTVGFLSNWLYGVLTFLAGFLALFVNEQLYKNAHAQMTQKMIAVGGAVLAVLSTLGIGVLAGLANTFGVAGLVSAQAMEAGIIVSLVGVAFMHGILWGVYYFTDPTHLAEMRRLVNMAYREQQLQGLEDAKKDLEIVKRLNDELEGYAARGEAELLDAAYENVRGHSLLNVPAKQEDARAIPADPKMPFLEKKEQTTPPLPSLDDESRG